VEAWREVEGEGGENESVDFWQWLDHGDTGGRCGGKGPGSSCSRSL